MDMVDHLDEMDTHIVKGRMGKSFASLHPVLSAQGGFRGNAKKGLLLSRELLDKNIGA